MDDSVIGAESLLFPPTSKRRFNINPESFEQSRCRAFARRKRSVRHISRAVQLQDDDPLLLRIDNPILRDPGRRIVRAFFSMVALTAGLIITDDFDRQVRS